MSISIEIENFIIVRDDRDIIRAVDAAMKRFKGRREGPAYEAARQHAMGTFPAWEWLRRLSTLPVPNHQAHLARLHEIEDACAWLRQYEKKIPKLMNMGSGKPLADSHAVLDAEPTASTSEKLTSLRDPCPEC